MSDLLPSVSGDRKVEKMENLVGELTEISASVHFTPCEIEADGPEDEESGKSSFFPFDFTLIFRVISCLSS